MVLSLLSGLMPPWLLRSPRREHLGRPCQSCSGCGSAGSWPWSTRRLVKGGLCLFCHDL